MIRFLDKSNEKGVQEKAYLLKLKFYNADRKMKSDIRCIFISIIMHPNFMQFRQKISFKSVEVFAPVSEHLKTALNESQLQIINSQFITGKYF